MASDLRLGQGAHANTQEAMRPRKELQGCVSRDILNDTEEHIDYLETQLELVEKVGLQNYLQSQMGGSSGS